MKLYLLLGCAGFIGTLLRYGCTRFCMVLWPNFPWGTLIVNVVGSFLAGVLFILCNEKFPNQTLLVPVLFIGFLGAFSTFSSYTLDTVRFLCDGHIGKFALNLILQNGLGLLAVILGIALAKMIWKSC